MRAAAGLAVCALVAGCGQRASMAERQATRTFVQSEWRAVATPADRTRLRDWRAAWTQGLRLAHGAGHGAAIAREGALLRPDAALGGAALPDGLYACRVIKIGRQGAAGGPQYTAYPSFDCRASREGGVQHLSKLTGPQRPTGHVYPDGEGRSVFLGTMMLSDERMAMRYGEDRARDIAGIVERVGPRRWRLALPYPRFESVVDVVELVPKA